MVQEGEEGRRGWEECPRHPWGLLNATAISDPGPQGAAQVGVQVWAAGGRRCTQGLTAWPRALGRVTLAGSASALGTGRVPGDLCGEEHS